MTKTREMAMKMVWGDGPRYEVGCVYIVKLIKLIINKIRGKKTEKSEPEMIIVRIEDNQTVRVN